MKKNYLPMILLLLLSYAMTLSAGEKSISNDYQRAQWDPIHFQPSIATATNQQCLNCHQEVIDRKVLSKSVAGLATESTKAWYQTLTTYNGEQQTFHQRHLTSDFAKQVMNMQCTTCHQGGDPREEAVNPPDHEQTQFTLRKSVNPETCLMCHGDFPDYKRMGLTSHWNTSRDIFQNNCLLCHAGIRTNRHQVNFLKAEAIETAGKEDSDVCFGCHGGRQWYRIAYPYPRNAWKGMADHTPEWAKDRPTESNPRFRIIPEKISKK
ncbi:MAG: hypothetical protein OQL19_02320 [Gammaproteobacteria bacterium]|nr:hypothetical protein [Gammaproteobacteria bacterium]